MKEGFLKRLADTGISKKDCIVMGTGILQAKGIREARDIDLLVRENVFEDCKRNPKWTYQSKSFIGGVMRESLKYDGIDLKKDFWITKSDDGLINDFDTFFKLIDTEKVDGWTFISLKTILAAKLQLKREKDKKDCELIKEYLINNT
jgi:hypothetical protein